MKIIWTVPATVDLENIKGFIGQDSQYYALRFVEKLFNLVENLTVFPRVGRKVPEANNENIRELIFQNYRIIYRLEHEFIAIIAVIHCARDSQNPALKPWESE